MTDNDRVTEVKKIFIPEGDYCYEHTGRVMINNQVKDTDGELMIIDYYTMPETKTCPYWEGLPEGDAHCSFLDVDSDYGDFDLLWDQIKVCEVNLDDDETHKQCDYTADYPDMDSVRKRSKRTPQLLSSMVNLLMQSPDNELKYDGITYTLSKHIWNRTTA